MYDNWEMAPYSMVFMLYSVFVFWPLIILGIVLFLIPKSRPYAAFAFAVDFGAFAGLMLAGTVAHEIVTALTNFLLNLPVPESAHKAQVLIAAIVVATGDFTIPIIGALLGSVLGVEFVRRARSGSQIF